MIVALCLALLAADAPAAVTGDNPVPVESTLTQRDPAYRIGKGLRCPVCQGMSIAESPSTMAQDMMKRVRNMLAEGQSEDQVYGYFIERYGEWVLLAPPTHGFSLWVWLTPPLFVLAALLMVVRQVRRLRAGKKFVPDADSATPATAKSEARDADAYLQAIRDEVQR